MMEKDTGHMYQITINKFGEYNDNKYVIGCFKNRKQKIQVYDMKPEYKELEGFYNNMKEIREKIIYLNAMEFYDDIKKFDNVKEILIGKCKTCHSYGDKDRPNYINGPCSNWNCSGRMKMLTGKYNSMQVDNNGKIYTRSGGSIAVCYDKGKWKYIN